MSESMRWFRMHSEWAKDPKVQTMSEAMQRRLTMLMCMKASGEYPAETPEVLFVLRITEDEWKETLSMFKSRGFLNENGDFRNWDKRQYKSDNSAERTRRYRVTSQKRHSDVTVTPSDTDTDTDTDTETEADRAVSGKPKRATAIPDDFELSEEMRDYALAKLPDMDTSATFGDFKDFHIHKGTTGRDWVRGWHTWVNNCVKGFKYAKAKRREQKASGGGAKVSPFDVYGLEPDGSRSVHRRVVDGAKGDAGSPDAQQREAGKGRP